MPYISSNYTLWETPSGNSHCVTSSALVPGNSVLFDLELRLQRFQECRSQFLPDHLFLCCCDGHISSSSRKLHDLLWCCETELNHFITVRAKVMFSQACVCPGGGCLLPGGGGEGVCSRGGWLVSQHALRQTPPPPDRRLLLQTVLILLECILVYFIIFNLIWRQPQKVYCEKYPKIVFKWSVRSYPFINSPAEPACGLVWEIL